MKPGDKVRIISANASEPICPLPPELVGSLGEIVAERPSQMDVFDVRIDGGGACWFVHRGDLRLFDEDREIARVQLAGACREIAAALDKLSVVDISECARLGAFVVDDLAKVAARLRGS